MRFDLVHMRLKLAILMRLLHLYGRLKLLRQTSFLGFKCTDNLGLMVSFSLGLCQKLLVVFNLEPKFIDLFVMKAALLIKPSINHGLYLRVI